MRSNAMVGKKISLKLKLLKLILKPPSAHNPCLLMLKMAIHFKVPALIILPILSSVSTVIGEEHALIGRGIQLCRLLYNNKK